MQDTAVITKKRSSRSSNSSNQNSNSTRKTTSKKGFMDGYSTYDDSMGRGTPEEWKATFYERMGIRDAAKIMGDSNPLTEFGLTEPITWEMIKAEFRKLAKQLHPDVNPSSDATMRMQRLNAAMTILEEKYGTH